MFIGISASASSFQPDVVSTLLNPSPSEGLQCHPAVVNSSGSCCILRLDAPGFPQTDQYSSIARCEQTGLIAAFWGRFHNRHELVRDLGILSSRQAGFNDAMLISAAWVRWGKGMLCRFAGEFALAIIEPDSQSAFLARDALGFRPLYYLHGSSFSVFSTSVSAFKRIKRIDLAKDRLWMLRYLIGISSSNHQTAYEEIHKLPPGHYLQIDAKSPITPTRWHHWQDDALLAPEPGVDSVSAYRQKLEEVVQCRLGTEQAIAVENSGGIDSAAIAAILSSLQADCGGRLFGMSRVFCEEEQRLVNGIRESLGMENGLVIEEYSYLPKAAAIEQVLGIRGYPEEHDNGSGAIPYLEACKQVGVCRLFSGFGGDEVVSSNGHLLRYELLDSGQYRRLLTVMPGGLLRRYRNFANFCLHGGARPGYNKHLRNELEQSWPYQLAHMELLEKHDLFRSFMEGARYDSSYRRINDFIINYHLNGPHISTRLESATHIAAANGISYEWPLLDPRLIQHFLSTPGLEKYGPGGISRYLHRRAVESMLPRQLALRPEKDIDYASYFRHFNNVGIKSVAQEAKRQIDCLHTELRDLIDVGKFALQVRKAEKGGTTTEFSVAFTQNVTRILWLNHWYHQDDEGC